jgi:predicted nucleotidyltransferase
MFSDSVITEAGRRLLKAAPAGSRVILFGSHARGEAGEQSDLDFLVIEPSTQDISKESTRLRRALNGLKVFADIIVVTEDEAKTWGEVGGTVVHAALTEGRLLAA